MCKTFIRYTPLYYLPPIPWFADLLHQDQPIIIDDTEHYQKQTYRNRCQILTSQGVQNLIIPTKHDTKQITKVKIDNTQRWAQIHWRSLITCYQKSPYFEHIAPQFENVFTRPADTLWEHNWSLLTICLKILKTKPNRLVLYSQYQPQYKSIEEKYTIDLPKSIDTVLKQNDSSVYPQVFGTEFVHGLSIIDLICNLGPASIEYLNKVKH